MEGKTEKRVERKKEKRRVGETEATKNVKRKKDETKEEENKRRRKVRGKIK